MEITPIVQPQGVSARPPRVANDRSTTLLSAQKETLELILAGAPLSSVLRRITSIVESESAGTVAASIMILDGEGRLRNAAAPSLPDHYLAAIDGLPAKSGVGTCCDAAARACVVVTPSFENAPSWSGLSHLPIGIGYVGAWSMPILSRDGRVLGTFGTYFKEVRGPTSTERAVVEVLARTAAIAIERDREDAERAARTAELSNALDAAQAAERAKGQFLAVMSHELRTPLTGIIGYADLLASGVAGPLSDSQTAHATRIKSAAWKLVELIDHVLTYSHLDSGRISVSLAPARLDEIVRESAELLVPHAAAKSVEVLVVVPDEQVTAMTDPLRVRQIVINLVGNAVKFTNAGVVKVMLYRDGSTAHIRVSDTGRGISAADHESVFEAFVQVDQSHTRTAGGVGLGLAVSRRLARLLGGELALVSSEVNAGSTFELTLPIL
jgi:signal transduction histidine kinase